MREVGKQTQLLFLSVLIIFATVMAAFQTTSVSAAQITNRKLTLVAGSPTVGGSLPGGVVKHEFSFSLPSNSSVGSIKFEYCTIATQAPCVKPTGLTTTSATLENETGATGFTMVNTTDGAPYLTRSASTATGAVTYRLGTVTNPTAAAGETFFVRISTYASTNATGSPIDTGTVTAATARAIELTGIMPESLIFCTGATVANNCTTSTSGAIAFNQLFSPTDTAIATSQMSASTNAGGGYAITVNGTTMTSGSNTIPALATPSASAPGTGQFGMNLRANTSGAATSFPAGSADLAPASDGVDLRGQPMSDYDTPDSFTFVPGAVVAQSNNGGAGPTNSQTYTASYIVNVAGNQLAGTYTTTLTYICTPTF